MSTILDALKKVERDRELPRDELLEVEIPPPRTRRAIPTRVIVGCASIGFAAGIGLALWRDTAPLEQSAVSEPVPPPVIEVPAAPPLPQAVAKAPEAAPNAPLPAADQPAAAPAAVAAAPATGAPASGDQIASASAPGPQPGVAPIAPAPPADAPVIAAPPPAAPPIAAPPPAAPPIAAPAPGTVPGMQGTNPSGAPPTVASVDQGGSALEPSPFGPARQAAPAPPPEPRAPRAGRKARNWSAPAPRAPAVEPPAPPPDTLALAPPAPALPPPVAVPPPAPPAAEAEPPPPPPVVIDTGRSPPGSPRVALTFLQWSADPARRFAFVSIDGAPAQRLREGDTASGLTVAEILPSGVQFKREGQVFVIRPRH